MFSKTMMIVIGITLSVVIIFQLVFLTVFFQAVVECIRYAILLAQ